MYLHEPDQRRNRSIGAGIHWKHGAVHKDGFVRQKANTSIQIRIQQYEEYVDELKPLRANTDFVGKSR